MGSKCIDPILGEFEIRSGERAVGDVVELGGWVERLKRKGEA